MKKPTRRLPLICLFLCGGLIVGSCSSGDGAAPPRFEPCTSCPTADLTGTWNVTAFLAQANGPNCNPGAVGQTITGQMSFVHTTDTTFTFDDGQNTGSGTVLGNTAQFSIVVMGVTETWDLVFSDDNTQMTGDLTVTFSGCDGWGTLTGSRISTSTLTVAEQSEVGSTVVTEDGLELCPGEHRVFRRYDGEWLSVARSPERSSGTPVAEEGVLRALVRMWDPDASPR